MTAGGPHAAEHQTRGAGLGFFIAGIALGATTLGIALARAPMRQPGIADWRAFGVLVAMLVVAEYLFVRFRFSGEINALNLVEAVVAPLIYAFPVWAVLPAVAFGQVAGAVLRKNAAVKSAFNVAQWTFAVGAGVAVMSALRPEPISSVRTVGVLLVVMAIIGVVNQLLFTFVLAIADALPLRRLLATLGPVMVPGWVAGWAVNTLTGLLFVFAMAQSPLAVILFPVPLVVLHLAYRGYAGARTDRVRLAGLPRAARMLSEPVLPDDAIAAFLREVASCFEAAAAALALRNGHGVAVHTYDRRTDACVVEREPADHPSLATAVLGLAGPKRITAGTREPDGRALIAAGWRDCLAAPLYDGEKVTGALMVLDQAGLEGFETGEIAVVEALAREAAATLAKGQLLHTVLEERAKLSEIVTSTSDGILTIAANGTVRSWNPAMESITGITAASIVDVPGALARLDMRTLDGKRVVLERWVAAHDHPRDIRIAHVDGRVHRLSCSYSTVRATDAEPSALVVVARDVTADEEIGRLRREFGRLAKAEAAQRAVVEQLQDAVMPVRPAVADVDLGVSYVASDPRSPTGGDLYDWQLLPSGDLHVAVVDVLGHGVAATKDALTVVHVLRILALEGCPLDEVVARADQLLAAHNPDLVATVVVARCDPTTGIVRLAGGGHPPALHLSPAGGVLSVPVPGGAIGWPGAGSEAIAEIALAPGDALVLYTDGLVEAKKNILEGTETLIRHARELIELPADELAEELVYRSLAEGDRRDDSLALAIRRAPAELELVREIEPAPQPAAEARRRLARWLETHALQETVVEDLVLVAGELLANAVAAARSHITLRAVVQRERDSRHVSIEVQDDGPGRQDLHRLGVEPPAEDLAAGRGLFIVRALSDDVTVLSTSEGTIIRALRRVRSEARPAGRTSAVPPRIEQG